METFQEALLKKTPCDECRVTKRRCSHERPCSRCIKKKIKCKYTIVVSPVDEEYMKELEYVDQIECLETQICLMENELNALRLAQDTPMRLEDIDAPTHYPSPVLTDSSDTPHVASWLAFEQDSSAEWKNNRLIADSGGFKIYVSPDKDDRSKKSSLLTVHKGQLSIHTFITSHTDLLNTLYDVLYSVDKHKQPSFLYSPSYFYETGALSSLMWRGYGKQWIKGIAKPMPLKKAVNRYTIPSDKMIMTTFQLIHGYIKCLHLTQFYIHVPYLMTHFIQPEQPSYHILESPAAMALCSTICLLGCHHISAILPPHSSTSYARYYFERARELISDRFDECTLEIMVTYTFMAFHKLKLNKDQETLKYIEMAKRIYATLEPMYHHSEASVFFYRVNRCIRYVYDTAMIHTMIKQGGHNKYGGQRDFSEMIQGNDMGAVTLSVNDSTEERDAILLVQLKTQLQQSFYTIMISKPSSEDLTSCIGEFSHQIEMALRHWYRHSLPHHFQLPAPLFEFNPSDHEFNLMLECNDKTPKLLCLIYLYYTYLLMSRCYLPKYPNEFHPPPDQVQEYLKMLERKTKVPATKRWQKFLYRKIHGKEHQLEGIDKDELKYIENLFMSVKQDEWNFNLPLAHTSVIAALQLVRLIQYLVTNVNPCFMDYKWLMNACEILLRASRFKYNTPSITLERIRSCITMCVKMIRDHAVYQVECVDDVVNRLEQEFEESVYI